MVAHHGVDHGARLLRRGGAVEIDERLAVDLAREDRKLAPDRLDVVGRVVNGAFIADLVSSPALRGEGLAGAQGERSGGEGAYSKAPRPAMPPHPRPPGLLPPPIQVDAALSPHRGER